MKRYDVLLFDADGTLLDFDADLRRAFAEVYRQNGFDRLQPDVSAALSLYRECNAAWWKRFNLGTCTKYEVEYGGFADLLEKTGLPGNPARLKREYDVSLSKGGVLFPGAEEMLRRLSRRYPIYVVTNGNADTSKPRMENSGLSRYLRGCFVSETVGFAKPDPRYFDYVFSHIPQFPRERAVLVGDMPLSDLQGAVNAGIDSIWYCPQPQESAEGVSYTYRAETYDDILRYLLHE